MSLVTSTHKMGIETSDEQVLFTNIDPPIAQMPDDILDEIFTKVCCDYINIRQGLGPVWKLQQVCTQWRRVARDTSSLWSTFRAEGTYGNMDAVALRIQLCLQLSKKALLSIYLSASLDSETFLDIARNADRWRLLRIDGGLLARARGETSVKEKIKQ
ncbi:hypothetical protein BDQ17DRAFT_1541524 [Cyathus striatus]|nr:hypothetical protein BDQ17DRAFT_1541524 [Cyathus striatus]